MHPEHPARVEADYRLQRLRQEAKAHRLSRAESTRDHPRRDRTRTVSLRRAVATYRRRYARALRSLS